MDLLNWIKDSDHWSSFVLPLIAAMWLIFKFLYGQFVYNRDRRADIYQRLIASAEEIRESYYEGMPLNTNVRALSGWIKRDGQWIRPDNWSPSARYAEAAKEMNLTLAGVALFGTQELADACFDLENIATKPKGDLTREQEMNRIINMMRRDLKSRWRNERVSLEWH